MENFPINSVTNFPNDIAKNILKMRGKRKKNYKDCKLYQENFNFVSLSSILKLIQFIYNSDDDINQ